MVFNGKKFGKYFSNFYAWPKLEFQEEKRVLGGVGGVL
jgi:hypothetical protein